MQTITAQLSAAFAKAIHAAFGIQADAHIAASANEQFGDYQSNAAMGLAKSLKKNPRAVAEEIKAKLDLAHMASEVSIAGPGFINIRLNPTWLATQATSLASDPQIGIGKVSDPEIVVVDYSGPNVAKEMHVGHLRSTIIGDAISRVIEFQGNNVIRQNHVGDWGTQFGMLIEYLRKQGFTGGQLEIQDLEEFYRQAKKSFDDSPEFQAQARARVVALQSGESFEFAAWQDIVVETRKSYQPVYDNLSVLLKSEHERGESFYNPFLAEVVAELKLKGLAVESQGAIVVPTEGFENPLIIEKTGGGYLYATTDLAAIRYRVRELHANRIIYTHDSRQAQHFAQVFQVARKAGFAPPEVSLEYAPFGTMLGEDGKPFKTRTGGTVKLKDLLDEAEERAQKIVDEKNPELPEAKRAEIAHAVGIGAVKYADLSKDRTSDYVFSWEKMLAMDGNTAPYLQYAHARIRSIFRRAGERGINYQPGNIQLESPFELALGKHLLKFSETVELVSRELRPHYLCTYLYELATKFSGFFENCPVIQSEGNVRTSRLTLCALTAQTLAIGLDLLGIGHPEQM
ncbi:MAG TPA: arginine--tRNA ligase [Tepidisphaeraceae bacterium]|jgi:arginyl-tRNA synthetase